MAVGLFGAMPVLAAEQGAMKMNMHQGMSMESKECVTQCALQAETIQQKIRRLQAEVKEGKKEYSAEELKKLQNKLKEANDLLDVLQEP